MNLQSVASLDGETGVDPTRSRVSHHEPSTASMSRAPLLTLDPGDWTGKGIRRQMDGTPYKKPSNGKSWTGEDSQLGANKTRAVIEESSPISRPGESCTQITEPPNVPDNDSLVSDSMSGERMKTREILLGMAADQVKGERRRGQRSQVLGLIDHDRALATYELGAAARTFSHFTICPPGRSICMNQWSPNGPLGAVRSN